MQFYRLLIGANNKTKKVEKNKINARALEYFPDGFTMYNARGAWLGGAEASVVLEVLTNKPARVRKLAAILKKELKQDAILMQKLPAVSLFV